MADKRSKTTTKTRTKKAKSAPKGTDDSVGRTSEGVAAPEVMYEAGNAVQEEQRHVGFYRFKLEQLEFLKEYAKDCDPKRAAKAVGVLKRTMDRWLLEDKFKAEIEEIHDVWRTNIKMTAEHAAARHIKLMNQLETDYHQLELEDRSKMANPLVKASETYLRAAGHFTHGGGDNEAQVVINIDLGGDESKGVTIDGKKVDGKGN